MGGLWPLNMGGLLRSYHTIAELSRRHEVTVLTTHGAGDDPDELARQLPSCKEVISIPYNAPKVGTASFAAALLGSWFSPLPVDLWKWRVPALRETALQIITNHAIDICVADFMLASTNVQLGGPVPVVLFSHNVEYLIWKRLCEVESHLWRRLLLEIEWRKMRRAEVRVCHQASLTIAVSEADRTLLAASIPGAKVCAIPTGVDTTYFAPTELPQSSPVLVFTGAMDWYPNEDAILFFIDAILPHITQKAPETRLIVVGRNPTQRLRVAAEQAGVEVTGTVDDVRPYIAEAAVYVVPLRVGGGTRLKIFEALAMGKAVVSTSVGAEGLPLIPGEHFLQADDPAEFAHAVLALLQDSTRRKQLGCVGRRLVEERYSWGQVAREFELRCEEVVAHHEH